MRRRSPALSAPIIGALFYCHSADVLGKDRDQTDAYIKALQCHLADGSTHTNGHVMPLRGIPGLLQIYLRCPTHSILAVILRYRRSYGSYLFTVNAVKCNTEEEGTTRYSEPMPRNQATSNTVRNPTRPTRGQWGAGGRAGANQYGAQGGRDAAGGTSPGQQERAAKLQLSRVD